MAGIGTRTKLGSATVDLELNAAWTLATGRGGYGVNAVLTGAPEGVGSFENRSGPGKAGEFVFDVAARVAVSDKASLSLTGAVTASRNHRAHMLGIKFRSDF